jgi:hypothetical protein
MADTSRNSVPGSGNGSRSQSSQDKKKITGNGFKGESSDMKGHVFQLAHEANNTQQFTKTMDMLKSYVAERFSNPTDVLPMFKVPHELPFICEPDPPEDAEDSFQRKRWERLFDDYLSRDNQLRGNLARLYNLIWGQCSKALKEKLKSRQGYVSAQEANDASWLIIRIKELSFKFEEQKYFFLSMFEAKRKLFALKQANNQTIQDYHATFVNLVNAIEHFGGTFGTEQALMDYSAKALGFGEEYHDEAEKSDEAKRASRQRFLATAFIMNSDRIRYGELIRDLANSFVKGRNEYPEDLVSAHKLLVEYQTSNKSIKKKDNSNDATPSEPTVEGHTFAQIEANRYPNVLCYNCNKKGHYASSCPERSAEVTMVHLSEVEERMEAISFVQMKFQLDHKCLLLDSESTVSVIKWSELVKDITKVNNGGVRAHTNGGHQDSSLRGYSKILPKIGQVWFNPESIANIYSLAHVSEHYRVTMDTAMDNAMIVHLEDGGTLRFGKVANGLYLLKLDDDFNLNVTKSNDLVNDYSFFHEVGTVQQNEANFTQREVQKAREAIDLMRGLGYVEPRQLIRYINHGGIILNSPVTADDVRRAETIYGRHPALLKGKAVRKQPTHNTKQAIVPVPDHVRAHYNDVTLAVDYFYVNKNRFLHTISTDIRFRTCTPFNVSPTTELSAAAVAEVVSIYQNRGFRVTDVHGDNEFEGIVNKMLPIRVRIAAAGAKVPEIERSIRTVRERARCITSDMPFRRIPIELCKGVVRESNRNLNLLPPVHGVSQHIGPTGIVTGLPPVNASHVVIRCGQYAQVLEHGSTDTNHKSKPRTVGAIALYQADPINNTWYFLSLATWRRIHVAEAHWTILPIPQNVVEMVEARAEHENQPIIQNGCPFFTLSRNGQELDDGDDESVDSEDDDDDSVENIDPVIQGNAEIERDENQERWNDGQDDVAEADEFPIEVNSINSSVDDEVEERIEFEFNDSEERTDDMNERIEIHQLEEQINTNQERISHTTENEDQDEDDAANEDAVIDNEDEDDENENVIQNDDKPETMNLRTNRDRNYDHLRHPGEEEHGFTFTMLGQEIDVKANEPLQKNQLLDLQREIVKLCETEDKSENVGTKDMIAAKAIKVFGEPALDAIYKEFAQINNQKSFGPLDPSTLTKEQKQKALREITLVKRKRCGRIKARMVADGRPQRKYIAKEDATSPTVSTEALLVSLIIDAFEGRDVATADVAGAYLHAKMDEFVIMKITNPHHIRIMCDIDPIYKEYITVENGKEVLYVQLLKALYGCIKSALLWYMLFTSVLKDMGFVLNPVDPCVANKDINGKQCTICWYVDDNKVSHVEYDVVTEILESIEKKFGKMSITRGKKHSFIGMDIDILENKKLKILMKGHIEEAINNFNEEITRTAPTPARKDLFEIDENSERLSDSDAENFHSVVALLLFIAIRARVDILLAISFLCTRVSKSTKQDKAKLKRVLEYLNGTRDLPYILGADSLEAFFSWIDAAFAVHEDMRGHTGGATSMGTGAFMVKSSKQKQNTLSSTECEHVGVAQYLPSPIWLSQFLKYQGYDVTDKTLYQDNESTIRFLKNGKKSAGKNSRHVDIRMFFSKDRIEAENIKVKHCRTNHMLSDFWSKPLQGALFRKFRDVSMGLEHIDTLTEEPMTTSEERVGDKISESHVDMGNERERKTYAEVTKEKTSKQVNETKAVRFIL